MKNIKLYRSLRTTSLVDNVKKDIYHLHLIEKKHVTFIKTFTANYKFNTIFIKIINISNYIFLFYQYFICSQSTT